MPASQKSPKSTDPAMSRAPALELPCGALDGEEVRTAPKEYRIGTLAYTGSGLGVLFTWLLSGDFGINLVQTIVPSVIPVKLGNLGVSSTLISIVMTVIPSVAMLCWNPIIASWSDRYRSRWGRRIPFLLGGMPAMVLVLLGMGYCDPLGKLFAGALGEKLSAASATTGVLMLAVLLFNMANSFVWHPYWALFNDTVPREVLGRFSMLFRIVSSCAVAVFNIALFPYANTHYRSIFTGVGIVFAAAYLAMCLNVKEGGYPPPVPLGAGSGGLSGKIKSYFSECFGHPMSAWICAAAACTMVGNAATPFILLMNQSLGLDLKQIGWINGCATLITLPAFLFAGLTVDRWNVVRVNYVGRCTQAAICAGFLVYLFAHLTVNQVMALTVVLNIMYLVVTAFMLVAWVPMQMRLLPTDRYGQFSSAMTVAVGASGILAGPLLGGFLDLMRRFHHGSDYCYRYAPLWMVIFFGLAGYFQYRIHRYVQSVCGDDLSKFVPPDTGSSNKQ